METNYLKVNLRLNGNIFWVLRGVIEKFSD
jgi:hypothetical protein